MNEKCEIWLTYLLWPLVFMAIFLVFKEVDPLLLGVWGSRSSAYLEQFRSGVALTWRIVHRLAQGDLWTVYVLLAYVPILLGAHLCQHKLAYYKIVNSVILIAVIIIVGSLLRLLMLPLDFFYH